MPSLPSTDSRHGVLPAADPFGTVLPTFTTERLRLRPVRRADDVEALLGVFGDAEAMRYWSHPPLADLHAAHAYIGKMEEGFVTRTLFQWVVADRESDRLIGTVTVFHWDRDNRRAEVGYVLGRPHWGRGLAQEAVRAALRFAFDRMGLHRVEADVEPANAASLKLLERLGFRREGLLRERWFPYGIPTDSVFLGLLREEFVGRASSAAAAHSPAEPDPFATGPYPDAIPPLRTPRLRLRALTAADDSAIEVLFSDERSLETWGHPPFTSRDDARAYRVRLEEGFQRRSLFVWGVFLPGDERGDGPLIGVGLLTRWSPNNRRVDLGYYLGSAYWGRGYATEAARALVAFAFGSLGVHRVEAEVVPGNDASARVLLRVGFRHEARLKERLWNDREGPLDSDLFRLLQPEFEA